MYAYSSTTTGSDKSLRKTCLEESKGGSLFFLDTPFCALNVREPLHQQ